MQTETRARYTTEDLITKSFLLRSISERVIAHELTLLSGLLEPVLAQAEGIRSIADGIAQIDLESAFALLALKQSYVRPEVLKDGRGHLEIVDGRHPVLDKLFTRFDGENDTLRQFTPNSLHLTTKSNQSNPVNLFQCFW